MASINRPDPNYPLFTGPLLTGPNLAGNQGAGGPNQPPDDQIHQHEGANNAAEPGYWQGFKDGLAKVLDFAKKFFLAFPCCNAGKGGRRGKGRRGGARPGQNSAGGVANAGGAGGAGGAGNAGGAAGAGNLGGARAAPVVPANGTVAETRLQALMKKEGAFTDDDTAEFNAIMQKAGHIKTLDLRENRHLSQDHIVHLMEALKDLRVLHLAGNGENISFWLSMLTIDDKDSPLAYLNLSGVAGGEDAIIQNISRLKNLKALNFSGCAITDAHLTSLVRKFECLYYLNFSGCQNLTGSGIAELIDRLEGLQMLDLSHCNAITAENHQKIAEVLTPELRVLNLNGLKEQASASLERYLSPEGYFFDSVGKPVTIGLTHLCLQDWAIDEEQLKTIATNCPSIMLLDILGSAVSLDRVVDLSTEQFPEMTHLYFGNDAQNNNKDHDRELVKRLRGKGIKELLIAGKTESPAINFQFYQSNIMKNERTDGKKEIDNLLNQVLIPFFKK